MKALSPSGQKLLRLGVLAVVAIETLFAIYISVIVVRGADPKGGGMELVAVGAAAMIYVALTLPALLIALTGRRHLILAAVLAGLAALAYWSLGAEVLTEMAKAK